MAKIKSNYVKSERVVTEELVDPTQAMYNIYNKDPEYDYKWVSFDELKQFRGKSFDGYEPIVHGESSGEVFGFSRYALKSSDKDGYSIGDVVACRCKKELKKVYKNISNKKYNSQVSLLRTAGDRAQALYKETDGMLNVTDESKTYGAGSTQKVGPTSEN